VVLSPVTQQALKHENGDRQPNMRPDLVDADVRHELVELPEHVRSKGQPERQAHKVEVVVGRDPQHEFEKEGVGFAGEEQDNHDGGEEEGAHTGHAVPLHFVPLVPDMGVKSIQESS